MADKHQSSFFIHKTTMVKFVARAYELSFWEVLQQLLERNKGNTPKAQKDQ